MINTDTTFSRRTVLKGAGVLALSSTGMACTETEKISFESAPAWMKLIGTSELGGRDYIPRVEGKLPQDLRGSLYRNGPGLFERGNGVIQHLLDGDGLVQRLRFTDRGVHYQNKFVATEKYIAEEAANKRLHATWSTRKTESFLGNLGGGVDHSQAGVTVYPVHGKILARDELGPTYEIDPDTLETIGTLSAGEGLQDVGFKAHSKLDPVTGEWIIAGSKYGRNMQIHTAIYTPDLRHKLQFQFDSPRQVYIHDFLVSREHIVFVLHPCYPSLFSFLAGLKSFIDGFKWRPEEGNLIAVVPRTGGQPVFFEAPGAFMWHGLNAFNDGSEVVADFVGYDSPDHFIGDNALMKNIMQGRMGNAAEPGKLRRYRMNMTTRSVTEEIVDAGNHEFPMVDLRGAMEQHRIGYFAWAGLGGFNSGLKRLDYQSGNISSFDFGPDTQVGEPVFAAKPGAKMDQGWLIAQCLDGQSEKTFFAVFDAENLSAGPVSKVWLEHPVPISFHGAWDAA